MNAQYPVHANSRLQVVPLLAQRFSRDYDLVIKQYPAVQQLEITQHLLDIVELFEQCETKEDSGLYRQFRDKEEVLLKKYGKSLQPYTSRQFYQYFVFDLVLAEKEIYATESFNALPGEEQRLSLPEIKEFLKVCHNLLYNAKTFIYLSMEPEAALTVTPVSQPEETDKECTKARQLLAIYFLLKSGFNVEHRETHSVAGVAKLAHLLTGTRFTTVQNSEIYKKYAEMPYYKKGQHLIADLQFIRAYFAELNLAEAVKLIDTEIAQTQKQLSKF